MDDGIELALLEPWRELGGRHKIRDLMPGKIAPFGVVAAKQGSFKGAGEWNKFEITCRGDMVTVILNGVKVADGNMGKEAALKERPRRGLIGLQNHGTGVEFRTVMIKVVK